MSSHQQLPVSASASGYAMPTIIIAPAKKNAAAPLSSSGCMPSAKAEGSRG